MSTPLLSVRNLRTTFRRQDREPFVAVEDLSYRVERGQALAVVGESGSGKTIGVRSLLRLLPSGATIESGVAEFEGRDLLQAGEPELRKIRGRRIGMIFQNAMEALNPTLTVERQLCEALLWHGLCSRREARRRAVRALGDAGIPEPERRIRMYPFQMSGGMRQRAMIAMALVAEPELIVADEPTTALDVTVQAQILDLLAEIKSGGSSMIMITHDLGVARRLCDDVVVMRRGETVEEGELRAVLDRPQHPYTKMLVAATPELTGKIRPGPTTSDAPLVVVEELSKSFRTRAGLTKAVDGVSLSISTGSTLGLVGESGSGKSTVARLVMGLYQRDAGVVRVDGVDPQTSDKAVLQRLRREMQMVFQNPFGSLLPHLTVGANVTEPLLLHEVGDRASRRQRVDELLELVGLDPADAQRYPQQFSGGQQQRVAIARALACEPRLLVCDEPTSSLDVSIQAQILELLQELQQRLQLTCLLISHNLAVVEQMADQVAVMQAGRIVEYGPADQVLNRPEHSYTETLLASVLPVRTAPA